MVVSRNDAPVSEIFRMREFGLCTSNRFDELGMGLSVCNKSLTMYRPYTESELLTPDVFESVPELKRGRELAAVTKPNSSVVFDSDSERVCFRWDGRFTPSGSVFDRVGFCVVT